MKRLNVCRILLLIGLLIGLMSLARTFEHVGDETYVLVPEFTKGRTHAWYHAFREGIHDVAAIVVFLIIFFGNRKFRTPATWRISLIMALGYYSSFWIGIPLFKELAAPNWIAESIHIAMALFTLSAIFIAKRAFDT